MDLKNIDKKISDVSGEIDFYSWLTPLNQKEEQDKFFSLWQRDVEYNPVFRYKENRFSSQKKLLKGMIKDLDEKDPLHQIFIKKALFILKQVELLGGDDKDFHALAVKLHGSPEGETIRTALEILTEGKNAGYVFPSETVTPKEMADILADEIKASGIDWKCALSKKIIPKVTVSGRDRTIYINDRINYTREEVERLKVHEIKVHIYRGANGQEQPFRIFTEGLADYNETEEGLALVAEDLSGVLETDTRQMKLYAGRAVCVHYCESSGFFEVFDRLREFFPDEMAYRLAERGKRGLRDTSLAGGLTKGFHYISGLQKVRRYVEENGDLSILYVGKIGILDVPSVKKLIADGVLKQPAHLPEFVE